MTFDPDDPRLTAYVLGELDPSEHAAIETMLDECPECRQAVEEIRKTVALALATASGRERDSLSAGGAEPSDGLRKLRLSSRGDSRTVPANPPWETDTPAGARYSALGGTLAALVLIAATISFRLSVPNLQKALPHSCELLWLEERSFSFRGPEPGPHLDGIADPRPPQRSFGSEAASLGRRSRARGARGRRQPRESRHERHGCDGRRHVGGGKVGRTASRCECRQRREYPVRGRLGPLSERVPR